MWYYSPCSIITSKIIHITIGVIGSGTMGSGIALVALKVGLNVVWIEDSPALILSRIVCMLANEAAFAAGKGG